MAKHRKPRGAARWPRLPLRSFATALSLAGVASAAGLLDSVALAEPEPTLSEVEERVDRLHRQAEEATERYNAATEDADRAEEVLDRLRDSSARHTARLNETRARLGTHAAARYRTAGLSPALRLALSGDPDDFLDRATLANRGSHRHARAARDIASRLRDLERLRTEAGEEAEALTEARETAREERQRLRDRLAEAEDLLATRGPEERERVLLRDQGAGGAIARVSGRMPIAPPPPDVPLPNGRAAAAVAFAYAQLGKAYGWGSTGPDAYDCSGLMQAAWGAAGVALPRTSYRQADIGSPVPLDALTPGDLVFYYSSMSHVGMYVGAGQIIHASRPGTPIGLAPVDSMPISAARRPA